MHHFFKWFWRTGVLFLLLNYYCHSCPKHQPIDTPCWKVQGSRRRVATIAEHSSGDAGPVDEMCFILRLYIPTWKKTQCINQTNTNIRVHVQTHTLEYCVCVYTASCCGSCTDIVNETSATSVLICKPGLQANASVCSVQCQCIWTCPLARV